MLDGASAATVARRAAAQPEQPAVHGVGAGGGEGDLVGAYAEALGDHRAGVVEQQPGVAAGAVEAPRVGVPLVERGQERLAGGRVQRLGGGGVEVRAAEPPRDDTPQPTGRPQPAHPGVDSDSVRVSVIV